jgi:hypothetical protein
MGGVVGFGVAVGFAAVGVELGFGVAVGVAVPVIPNPSVNHEVEQPASASVVASSTADTVAGRRSLMVIP